MALAILAYQEYTTDLRLKAQMFDPNTGLQRELADAQKSIKGLRDQLASLKAARQRTRATSEDDGAGGPGRNWGNRRAQIQALMDSPQFQALRALQSKSQLDGRYADLFKQLNLSPQQLEQFKSLLVQRQDAATDAAQAARQNGISPRSDPQAWQSAIAAATGDIDNQIKTDLGDSGYSAYQSYQQSAPQRATVTQLQQSLSYTSAPLTDAQSQQLVALMQQNSPSSGQQQFVFGGGPFGGGGPGGGGPGGGGPPAQISNDVITQASNFLNPTQVAALQQLQQTQQAGQQMRQLMQAQFQNRGSGQ